MVTKKRFSRFIRIFAAGMALLCTGILFGACGRHPSQTSIGKGDKTCTLEIRCDTIQNHLEWFDPEKKELLPEDGAILPVTEIRFEEGATVFDVLLSAVHARNIHFEYSQTTSFGTVYIEGIGNIYEFDCGDLSGWVYSVNGDFPMYGCSDYELHDGDVIQFLYTCDLGEDLGNIYME